jgi:hypothetical protein
MMSFIKDIALRLTGVRAILVKVIDSVQSAVRVIELIQSELKSLGVSDTAAVAIELLKDWLTVIINILTKVLSIKVDDVQVFAAGSDPIEELKKKIDALKSLQQ